MLTLILSIIHMFGWGAGSAGQLGNGRVDDAVLLPELILKDSSFLVDTKDLQISGGGSHSVVWKESISSLIAFGANTDHQINGNKQNEYVIPIEIQTPFQIKSISLGWNHSLAISTDGKLYGWGNNRFGQLGLGPNRKHIDKICLVPLEATVLTVSTMFRHTITLCSDGSLWGFGDAKQGQLVKEINKKKKFLFFPTEIRSLLPTCHPLRTEVIASIACGMKHSLFQTNHGNVWVVGDNKFNQVNVDSNIPRSFVPQLVACGRSRAIHSGWNHFIAVMDDQNIYLQGRNNYGQLGKEGEASCNTLRFDSPIKKIIMGSEHSLLLTSVGTVFGWGWNEHGQLGLSHIDSVFIPQPLDSLPLVSNIHCGIAQCFASEIDCDTN